MDDESFGKYIFFAFISIVIALFSSFYIVRAGNRAVLVTFGNPSPQPLSEGIHFKIPFVQSAIIMNVQTQKYEVTKATASSADLQTVDTDVTINYYVNPESTPELYSKVGLNYQDKIIAPAVQEVVKAITAKYTAEELITKRAEVKDKIDTSLAERLKTWNVNVQAVSITNFEFSPEFNQAIETKVTAEQNALAEKNNLAKVQYQAQQRVAQAQGEADAIKIQSQAIISAGGKDYIQLQAISKWSGQLPYVVGGNSLPFINIPIGTSLNNQTNSTQ